MQTRRAAALAAAALLLAGCSHEGTPAPASSAPTVTPTEVGASTSDVPSSTPATVTPHPAHRVVRRTVVLTPATTVPAPWREAFVVAYGPGRDRLGTSIGGDAGSLRLGPEYGAPAADDSWWFLDAAKLRLAHYDAFGAYLGEARIPRRILVGGGYFQWQLPHVMADGTVVAVRQEADGSAMLRLRDGVIDEVPIARPFAATYDDGRLLYDGGRRGSALSVDPATGAVARAALRLPSGGRLGIHDDFDRGVIAVETEAVTVRLRTVTGSGSVAHMGIQVRAGVDDTVHLYLTGFGDEPEAPELVGYVGISSSGQVTAVDLLPDPYSDADPGSPAQLQLAPGTTTPSLVYVMPDGVHVYRRG